MPDVQEQEQQLHEKRVKHCSIGQNSLQHQEQPDGVGSSTFSLQMLQSARLLDNSINKRPDTAYEGRLAALAGDLQLSTAGSAATSYADCDASSFAAPAACDTIQAGREISQQAELHLSDALLAQSCSTVVKGCESASLDKPAPPIRDGKIRPSPKSRQLSQNVWL